MFITSCNWRIIVTLISGNFKNFPLCTFIGKLQGNCLISAYPKVNLIDTTFSIYYDVFIERSALVLEQCVISHRVLSDIVLCNVP